MRRIKTTLIVDLNHSSGWEQGVSRISNADLRLLLAVVRAAEALDKDCTGSIAFAADLRHALDRLNAKQKGKRT
jgi:hypothetical protein